MMSSTSRKARSGRQVETLPNLFESLSSPMPYADLDPAQLNPESPELFYSHPNGEIWVGDALAWLTILPTASVDLVFADPPYNIKKAEWDTFESQQAYVA